MTDTEKNTQSAEMQTTDTKKKSKKQEKTFEDALARLQEIVTALEDGSAPLDKSLGLYEEGISLIRFCSEKLDAAEAQIKVLTRAENGDIVERNFTQDN